MPKRWRITYNLAQSIEVQNQVADYPNLEVSLLYDTNKIAGVEHSFNTDDSVDEIGAIGMSQEQLKLFWELLHYKRGFPIAISSRTAEYTTSATGTPGTRTGFASASMSVAIAKLVTMPNQGLFTNPDSRLTVWLRLANDARTAVVDADAIRNYYIIDLIVINDRLQE